MSAQRECIDIFYQTINFHAGSQMEPEFFLKNGQADTAKLILIFPLFLKMHLRSKFVNRK